MAGYVHDDIKEILDDAASNNIVEGVKSDLPSTKGWTKEQLASLDTMLQFAWNRGYKSACNDMQDN